MISENAILSEIVLSLRKYNINKKQAFVSLWCSIIERSFDSMAVRLFSILEKEI